MKHDLLRIFSEISGRIEKNIDTGAIIPLKYAHPKNSASEFIKKLPPDAELHVMVDAVEIRFDTAYMRLLSDGNTAYEGNVPENLREEWSAFIENYRFGDV